MRAVSARSRWRERDLRDAQVSAEIRRRKNEEIGRKLFWKNRANWVRIHRRVHRNGKEGAVCHLCHVGPEKARELIDEFYRVKR